MLLSIGERIYSYWLAQFTALAPGPSPVAEDYTTQFGHVTGADLRDANRATGDSAEFQLLERTYSYNQGLVAVTDTYRLAMWLRTRDYSNDPHVIIHRAAADIFTLLYSDQTSGTPALTSQVRPLGLTTDTGEDTARGASGIFVFEAMYRFCPSDPSQPR